MENSTVKEYESISPEKFCFINSINIDRDIDQIEFKILINIEVNLIGGWGANSEEKTLSIKFYDVTGLIINRSINDLVYEAVVIEDITYYLLKDDSDCFRFRVFCEDSNSFNFECRRFSFEILDLVK